MIKAFLKAVLMDLRGTFLYPFLRTHTLEVRTLEHLHKVMNWDKTPKIDKSYMDFSLQYIQDLNDRRIRDAEVIASACANTHGRILLEIGTAEGRTSALMAANAPQAKLYTINITPEEMSHGGKLTTHIFSREEIGSYYKAKGLKNIIQVFANTKHWKPEYGTISVAFIDGCHDADFVFNDTRKILECCEPGSVILWHDFDLEMIRKYDWIAQVAKGIERLYRKQYIHGPIFHLQDSFVALYVVK